MGFVFFSFYILLFLCIQATSLTHFNDTCFYIPPGSAVWQKPLVLTADFQPKFFIPVLIIGTIDIYHCATSNDRLVGLVVKASASRAGGPGFESR